MLPVTLLVSTFLVGIAGLANHAEETGAPFRFEEHPVEFHNQDVKLVGSLILPIRERPVPAVEFVHGAGPQTREPYREVAEHFASQGIAALIYDKRGVGQSGGDYEGIAPYENLVNDALAAVAFLDERTEIAPSQIGIWGLSQGAYIGAAAASRTDDIKFIIAAGASAAHGTKFYYRDNLFQRYGLSDTLRDVAEKTQLTQDTLPYLLRNESFFASFLPRSYPPPDKFVHPAWSRVHQPVLVMWGQLDQHQPVGESILGLKNSLAQADNPNWTMIILPRANHDLGASETGELHRGWHGYAPGALQTMTDWAHQAIDDPALLESMKQVGSAQEKGVLAKLVRYEKFRWYSHWTVQATLLLLFLVSFLANTIGGVRYGWRRLLHRHDGATAPPTDKLLSFKRALSALNLLILMAFTITVQLVFDQMFPRCPAVLMYLPLLGTISALATVALLIALATTRRGQMTARSGIRWKFDVLCLILFVPYLYYWNLIGLHF
ncbi:MAG: alpha/beta hydrolase family protein [Pirellulales bacterium]